MFFFSQETQLSNCYFQRNPRVSLRWWNYSTCQRKPHTSEILSMACISDPVKLIRWQLLLVCHQIKQGCERELRDETLTQLNTLCGRRQPCSDWMLKDSQPFKTLSHAACMTSRILKAPLFCKGLPDNLRHPTQASVFWLFSLIPYHTSPMTHLQWNLTAHWWWAIDRHSYAQIQPIYFPYYPKI